MGVAGVVVVVAVLVVSCHGLVKTPSVTRSNTLDPVVVCRDIKFSDPSRRSSVREEVLRDLCEAGVVHAELDDTKKQFAVFNLHRDAFEQAAKWYSGDAEDVMSDKYWVVNDVNTLATTKYHWYIHGLPMWPLPHQALANTTAKLSLKPKKPVDWPNYGLATPVYYAAKAWRNQAWSLEEFFQQEKKKSPFKSHKDFHKLAKDVVVAIDGQHVENYSDWPFLRYSLVPMVNSMKLRTKGLCPDEVYIYSRVTLCHPSESSAVACSQVAQEARTLLTQAGCRTTDVILGYTLDNSNPL